MKAKICCLLLFLGMNLTAIGQKERLSLVADLGEILAKDDPRNPPSKVLPIIFAKLEKKYSLKKPSKTIEGIVGELIERRRKYTASRTSGALEVRAYDQLIAGTLTIKGDVKPYDAACDGLKQQLSRALKDYDDALKNYQKCLNDSSVSTALQVQSLDGMFGGGPMSDIPTGATGSNCYKQKRSLKQMVDKVESLIKQVNAACKKL